MQERSDAAGGLEAPQKCRLIVQPTDRSGGLLGTSIPPVRAEKPLGVGTQSSYGHYIYMNIYTQVIHFLLPFLSRGLKTFFFAGETRFYIRWIVKQVERVICLFPLTTKKK